MCLPFCKRGQSWEYRVCRPAALPGRGGDFAGLGRLILTGTAQGIGTVDDVLFSRPGFWTEPASLAFLDAVNLLEGARVVFVLAGIGAAIGQGWLWQVDQYTSYSKGVRFHLAHPGFV